MWHCPPQIKPLYAAVIYLSFLCGWAGTLEFPSNTSQVSERQKVIEASQKQQGLIDIQHNLPNPGNFQEDEGSATTYDAAYVKMLESYVVQLKFENNVLRLSTAS